MINQNKLLLLFAFFLVVAIIVFKIPFIPSWDNTQQYIFITLFGLATLAALVYLRKAWFIKGVSSSNPKDHVRKTITSVAVILLLAASLFIIITQETNPASFVKKYEFNGTIVYQYEKGCMVPDNKCECDNYYSSIYTENPYLPTMSLTKKADFYVKEINLDGNRLTIKSSDDCPKDRNKKLIVFLK